MMLASWSQVHQLWQLYKVFAGLGVAMAAALYDVATAVIVSWFDDRQRPRALPTMIVVARFAKTIFMPLTGLLEARFGWLQALLILAAAYATTAVPLHGFVIRRPAAASTQHSAVGCAVGGSWWSRSSRTRRR